MERLLQHDPRGWSCHAKTEEFTEATVVPRWSEQFYVLASGCHGQAKTKQYVWMNLLQAPLLALVLSVFTRYRSAEGEFVYRLSENLPQFLSFR